MAMSDESKSETSLCVEIHFVRFTAIRYCCFDKIHIALADFLSINYRKFCVELAQIQDVIKIGIALRFRKLGSHLLAKPVLRIVGPANRSVKSLAERSSCNRSDVQGAVGGLLVNFHRPRKVHGRHIYLSNGYARREFLPCNTPALSIEIAIENLIGGRRCRRGLRGRSSRLPGAQC